MKKLLFLLVALMLCCSSASAMVVRPLEPTQTAISADEAAAIALDYLINLEHPLGYPKTDVCQILEANQKGILSCRTTLVSQTESGQEQTMWVCVFYTAHQADYPYAEAIAMVNADTGTVDSIYANPLELIPSWAVDYGLYETWDMETEGLFEDLYFSPFYYPRNTRPSELDILSEEDALEIAVEALAKEFGFTREDLMDHCSQEFELWLYIDEDGAEYHDWVITFSFAGEPIAQANINSATGEVSMLHNILQSPGVG